jgi:hypothetical protein
MRLVTARRSTTTPSAPTLVCLPPGSATIRFSLIAWTTPRRSARIHRSGPADPAWAVPQSQRRGEPDPAAAQVRTVHAKMRPVGPVMPTSA